MTTQTPLTDTTTLFRPVGLYELLAVLRTGWRRFPPRLPEQPIFYPVLNHPYAAEIASQWNPVDANSGYSGFVTCFEIPATCLARWPRETVGARRHEELWVPADEQRQLEDAIQGDIRVIDAWAGPHLKRALPSWQGHPGHLSGEALTVLLALIATDPVLGGPQTLAPALG